MRRQRGTKFPVRSVVNYVLRHGLSPEELVKEFTHLTLAQIYDTLSYYYDHKDSIDNDLGVKSTDSTPDAYDYWPKSASLKLE